MEVYFDNSATTKCSENAAELMMKVLTEEYGNPSSLHLKGIAGESYLKEARNRICKTLKINDTELFFTSGGTESNNLAIIGAAMANKRSGMHLITTKIEHPAVLSPMRFLEEQGFSVTYLDVDEYGLISLDELKKAITQETILVSIMYVNNEIGTVEPVEAAARIIKEKNPNALFHVDAIQAYGKYQIYPKRMGIDMMSVSSHKIHGPKGVGFLYVKERTKIKPIIFGGGQQKGIRSGTENVPGIAGMGQASSEAYEKLEENQKYLYELKEAFIKGVEELEWAHINGKTGRDSAPHIVSVSFDDVRSEVLLHTLEDRGIYVSAGSACSSNKTSVSETLKTIKVKREYLDTTVRFSFCPENTIEEVQYCLDILKEVVPMLRKYVRH